MNNLEKIKNITFKLLHAIKVSEYILPEFAYPITYKDTQKEIEVEVWEELTNWYNAAEEYYNKILEAIEQIDETKAGELINEFILDKKASNEEYHKVNLEEIEKYNKLLKEDIEVNKKTEVELILTYYKTSEKDLIKEGKLMNKGEIMNFPIYMKKDLVTFFANSLKVYPV